MSLFDLPAIDAIVAAAVAEDVGRGDLTTQLTVADDVRGRADIIAKQSGILAGLPLVAKVYACVSGARTVVEPRLRDGASFVAGTRIASLFGGAADLLTGERVALNFLQHLSGIATLTHRFVAAVASTRARIVDTRKTVPGLRLLEKYAVRMGGGHNHRLGLDDGILIKNNHLTAAGGVGPAIARARQGAPHTVKIEVECASLGEVDEALDAGADLILLDNMQPAQLAAAVTRIGGRALTEASGGVNLDTVREIAASGVDLISVGALTHSAPAIDLHMRMSLV